jgi:hypothetical protein
MFKVWGSREEGPALAVKEIGVQHKGVPLVRLNTHTPIPIYAHVITSLQSQKFK